MNTPSSSDTVVRTLESGHTLIDAGQNGPIWRVRSGVLRLERPGQEGMTLVQLALPGDLIGVEALCAQAHAFSATALVDTEVETLDLAQTPSAAAVAQGFLQQQRQMLDMVRLRSGPIHQRLAYLLTVLGKDPRGRARIVRREELPTLREMAQIIDSALETVCRELNALMPRKTSAVAKPSGSARTRQRTRWVRPSANAPLGLAA